MNKKNNFLCVVILSLIFSGICHAQQGGLRKSEVKEIVNEVCQLITDHYVYPDIALRISDTLGFRKIVTSGHKEVSKTFYFNDNK